MVPLEAGSEVACSFIKVELQPFLGYDIAVVYWKLTGGQLAQ